MNTSEPSRSSGFPESDNSDSGHDADHPVFDAQLNRVLFDINVPSGLRETLLQSLSDQENAATLTDLPLETPRKRFLHHPRLLAGLSACLVLAAVLTFLWAARQPTIALARFGPELNLDSRLLPEFDQHFPSHLPVQGGWDSQGQLTVYSKTYGVTAGTSGSQDAAARFFRLRTGNNRSVFGALLQIPAWRVTPLPTQSSFDSGQVEYSQLNKGNYTTVRWIENDQVYVCIVFGGARELEALGRALQSTSA
ncbi:hypothetical protein [Gimesia sp.]|uniref:hypothetical protein n=1 Tax=Gimesia sp. TaxID=2024833 RepID=UPI000C4EB5C7|nr:hypothetical protein [Gimesia sp.]MAX40413.1 hypothetical protein [Gimesia sp.]HAH49355.1 hypothetical protein [Planctomycetaceae bacterium]|tara:strand:+ start:991 stop:1743 length:753 start_codon:yes stop_codon:yes gene_type:complete